MTRHLNLRKQARTSRTNVSGCSKLSRPACKAFDTVTIPSKRRRINLLLSAPDCDYEIQLGRDQEFRLGRCEGLPSPRVPSHAKLDSPGIPSKPLRCARR